MTLVTTTGTATELWRMSATELADMIRSRQVSSREVVDAHLGRIEAVNPVVNAVTVVLAERARDAADAADRAVAAGDDLPVLHGVPFTVKENLDLVGTPTTCGARALADAYPGLDAPVVERLKEAGAIPIGRTNCPTFAVRWHTDSELWGPTINPWDRSRTPGASSGGEAVALATGMSALGLGNDTLGSLRWPAQCCGVSTVKPTLGRIPHANSTEPVDVPIGVQLAATDGPLARRVADLRVALAVLAGPTWRDPWTVPAPLRGPRPAEPVRVALVVDPAGQGTAAQVRDGVRRAAAALADAGYAVDEVEPPGIELAAKTLLDMLNPPDVRPEEMGLMFPSPPVDTVRFMAEFSRVAADPDASSVRTYVTRQSLLRAWGGFQQIHPLIVAPAYTGIPFPAGTDLDEGRVAETIRGMRMVLAVSALGLPAVVLPVGTADGLPQAVQLIGPRYREDLCLDAAAAIEDRLGILTPIDPR
jgi:amidase